MYADDTTLYCNISQNIGEEVISAELSKIWEWLGANKLSLNIAKTKKLIIVILKRLLNLTFWVLYYILI